MTTLGWILLGIIHIPVIVALIVLYWAMSDGSGSYTYEDGTIVEWDGIGGGGRIVDPDGTLHEYPAPDKQEQDSED